MAIKLLISDFDGTLADTFEANFRAYRQAFESIGKNLSRQEYKDCFGFRFDRFMDAMDITDIETRRAIKDRKAIYYPEHFDCLTVNAPLLQFIRAFHQSGGMTAIASTARRENLHNALSHLNAVADFDLILSGESVSCGKPNPEIYLKVLEMLSVDACDALVFEDSEVGIKAAEAAGIKHIMIKPIFFDNGN